MARRVHGRARTVTDTNPVWVVTVDYRGEVLRWASRPIGWGLVDGAGVHVAMVGSWVPPDEINLVDDVSVTVEVLFPESIPLAARELAGRATLAGCAVEVAWVPTAGAWEDRFVAVRGYVDGPRVGGPTEPVTFGVVAATLRPDTNQLPHASHTVTAVTWPTAPESSLGKTYPIVYGQPGAYMVDGELKQHNGSPALVVETEAYTTTDSPPVDLELTSRLLINWRPVSDGTTVFLRWQDSDSGDIWYAESFPVDMSQDGLGQLCATVDMTGALQKVRKVTVFYVSWTAPVDGRVAADQVAAWWLSQSDADVDLLASREGLAALRGLRLSGYTDAPITPSDWVADRLQDLPVEFVDGPNGRYLKAIPWQAQASQAVARIEVVNAMQGPGTTGAVRVTPLQIEGGTPTEIEVTWAPKIGGDGRMVTTRTIAGKITARSLIGTAAKPASGAAPTATKVQLVDVWDEATAAHVARYVAWREGRTKRTITLSVPADGYAWLRPWDVVLYTDTALGVVDQVAVLQRVNLTTAAAVSFELMFP